MPRCVLLFRRRGERRKAIGSLRGNIAISISAPTPRNTRNDLRSGAWCFDGGQPEVNLRFTRQYRLLLAPPRALPRVPRGTARARAPHNSHNKSPRTTDARSTYKGITDQKENRRVGKGGGREVGARRGGGGEGKDSQQWVDPDRETAAVAKGVVAVASRGAQGGPIPMVVRPGESMKRTSSRKSFIARCLNLRGSLWSADRYTATIRFRNRCGRIFQ